MHPPPPPVPAYEPNFAYKSTSGGKKLDVTIGVIAPQFTTNSALYHQNYKDDEVVKRMLSGMSASFNEILISKGFNTKGPFTSLNDMTFPEKKGSDLLLYPEFDFQVQVKAGNFHADTSTSTGQDIVQLLTLNKRKEGAPADHVCDIAITVDGNLLFVAQEPLSGERMWIKRLDVSKASVTIPGQKDAVCDGGPMNQTVRNEWAKAHELVYQDSMKSFDNYVNGEEFQMLKKQSLELRAKKAY